MRIVRQVEFERLNFDQGTYCTQVSCESSVEYRSPDPEKKVENATKCEKFDRIIPN